MKHHKSSRLRRKLFLLFLCSMLFLLICIGSVFWVLMNRMQKQRSQSLSSYSDVMTQMLTESNMTSLANTSFQYARLYASLNALSLYDLDPYGSETDFKILCSRAINAFITSMGHGYFDPEEDIFFVIMGDLHYSNYPHDISWEDVEKTINEYYAVVTKDYPDEIDIPKNGIEWIQSEQADYVMYESEGNVHVMAFTEPGASGTVYYPFKAGIIHTYYNTTQVLENLASNAIAAYNDETEKQDKESFREAILFMVLTVLIIVLLCLIYTRVLSKYIADPIEMEQFRAQQEKEALEETNRMKTTFLSDVSHELKTPLAAMSGYAQNAEIEITAGCDTTVIQEKLRRITSEANRMALMVTQILDATRIEEGRMILDQTPCDLETLVRETAETYFAVLNKNNNRLMLRIPLDLPCISADTSRLKRVFVNLISNAMKHTHNGTIVVKAEQENDFVRVTVKDTGNGISEEDLPHIWERYYKGKHSETGTGLGLFICKFIVESHGGTIDVESAVGKGTSFSFTVPCSEPVQPLLSA